jgi:hypothetical protein
MEGNEIIYDGLRVALVIALFTLMLFPIQSCSKQPMVVDDLILDNPQDECQRVDGEWTTFSNGCVDSCEIAKDKNNTACTMALTDGCECGTSKCWDGKTCIPN